MNKKPKYKIGDTVVLKKRWFLWWQKPVLCEIVGGRLEMDTAELGLDNNGEPHWRYTLHIGNAIRRFCVWECELLEQDMADIRTIDFTPTIKKLKKWICKKIGHRFNPILLTMFEIKHKAINREVFKNETIKCQRCGSVFTHKFTK